MKGLHLDFWAAGERDIFEITGDKWWLTPKLQPCVARAQRVKKLTFLLVFFLNLTKISCEASLPHSML